MSGLMSFKEFLSQPVRCLRPTSLPGLRGTRTWSGDTSSTAVRMWPSARWVLLLLLLFLLLLSPLSDVSIMVRWCGWVSVSAPGHVTAWVTHPWQVTWPTCPSADSCTWTRGWWPSLKLERSRWVKWKYEWKIFLNFFLRLRCSVFLPAALVI